MQSLGEEPHGSATSSYNTPGGVKVNKNASLHPVALDVYISFESHIPGITPFLCPVFCSDDSPVVRLTKACDTHKTKVMGPCVQCKERSSNKNSEMPWRMPEENSTCAILMT
ncbi:Gamma-glutamyl phosphate reductase [Dissostichus eleginoides]|uniref:Gamma-glutamyl phosphate reductase n=1 Tax=Dissostichus eleginoides TaxID=100907 RepID=A0AAD9CIE9_DISEL|nr:Gamma-glutamyl phosphate reductase [Dissostichus eleginoides]